MTPNRDVILEVPELAVDSIGLTVANVRAHVALDANAMNLVQVTAGVDVGIQQVQLRIVGVLAEAYLYVDLPTWRESSTASYKPSTETRRS